MEHFGSIFTLVIVPYLVGVLTKWLMNVAKNVAVVDNAPNGGKRLLVVAISTALTLLASYAGVHLTDLGAINATDAGLMASSLVTGLSALVSAIYAMAAHAGDKASGTS